MASRDQRVKGIEEMLNGISTIKQNSFYDFFYKKVRSFTQLRLKKSEKPKWMT